MKKVLYFIGGTIIIVSLVLTVYKLYTPGPINTGSVNMANEYHATTTQTGITQTSFILCTGQGAFGSIVRTSYINGYMNVYDATTSNVLARTGNIATSSLPMLASLPPNATTTTYTYDVYFTNGLLIEQQPGAGKQGTSTITYRCY